MPDENISIEPGVIGYNNGKDFTTLYITDFICRNKVNNVMCMNNLLYSQDRCNKCGCKINWNIEGLEIKGMKEGNL